MWRKRNTVAESINTVKIFSAHWKETLCDLIQIKVQIVLKRIKQESKNSDNLYCNLYGSELRVKGQEKSSESSMPGGKDSQEIIEMHATLFFNHHSIIISWVSIDSLMKREEKERWLSILIRREWWRWSGGQVYIFRLLGCGLLQTFVVFTKD